MDRFIGLHRPQAACQHPPLKSNMDRFIDFDAYKKFENKCL